MTPNSRSYLGRFAQADTIVPGGVQGLDRYAYVSNSPMNYVDPSGHEPKYGCYSSTNGVCTNANGTTFDMTFAGSGSSWDGSNYVVDVTQPNTVKRQIPLYSGLSVIEIDYPGYIQNGGITYPGKPLQARNAQGKYESVSVNLLCYSAGTEACLMYARWRIENGQQVNSVVLLGPTFASYRENEIVTGNYTTFGAPTGHDRAFDGWADYVDLLIQHNIDVLIISDGPASQASGAGNFVANPPEPGQTQGTYTYTEKWQGHFSSTTLATNNNPEIKQAIYHWIFTNSLP